MTTYISIHLYIDLSVCRSFIQSMDLFLTILYVCRVHKKKKETFNGDNCFETIIICTNISCVRNYFPLIDCPVVKLNCFTCCVIRIISRIARTECSRQTFYLFLISGLLYHLYVNDNITTTKPPWDIIKLDANDFMFRFSNQLVYLSDTSNVIASYMMYWYRNNMHRIHVTFRVI